ncbi:hypothetical protein HDV05_005685 [Chytridiales sp. JEL 0842]|nr:hypothetical protein HDV05_005685 [Chytridiales sp. JEL 0842]
MTKKILVTGGAGFIGSHTAETLLSRGDQVVVVDELNDYYDLSQKEENLRILFELSERLGVYFRFYKADVADMEAMEYIFEQERPDMICHLAARAGVRPSIQDPFIYIQSNITGTTTLLTLSHKYSIKNFVYASSSSVYGGNTKVPFSELDPTEHPISPYAASKKATELMASTYNHLYKLPVTGLRFFTVYGPRGRPDMAPFLFVKKISEGTPIDQFGDGSSSRDYTYITDIVSGILASLDTPRPCAVFNLGNSSTVTLSRFIQIVENTVGKKAIRNMKPEQPGDVKTTYADLTISARELGYNPQTPIEEGIRRLVAWYQSTRKASPSTLLAPPKSETVQPPVNVALSIVLRAPLMRGKRVPSYASLQQVLMECTPPPSPPLSAQGSVETGDSMSSRSSDAGESIEEDEGASGRKKDGTLLLADESSSGLFDFGEAFSMSAISEDAPRTSDDTLRSSFVAKVAAASPLKVEGRGGLTSSKPLLHPPNIDTISHQSSDVFGFGSFVDVFITEQDLERAKEKQLPEDELKTPETTIRELFNELLEFSTIDPVFCEPKETVEGVTLCNNFVTLGKGQISLSAEGLIFKGELHSTNTEKTLLFSFKTISDLRIKEIQEAEWGMLFTLRNKDGKMVFLQLLLGSRKEELESLKSKIDAFLKPTTITEPAHGLVGGLVAAVPNSEEEEEVSKEEMQQLETEWENFQQSHQESLEQSLQAIRDQYAQLFLEAQESHLRKMDALQKRMNERNRTRTERRKEEMKEEVEMGQCQICFDGVDGLGNVFTLPLSSSLI